MIIGLNEYCTDLVLNRQMSILESYIYEDDIFSECFDMNIDLLSESFLLETTNIDMIKAFKSTISEVKKDIKAAKKCKDQEESKKYYTNAISKLDELERYLRSINDFKTSSKVLGSITSILLTLGLFVIMNIYNIVKTIKDHNDTKRSYENTIKATGIQDKKKENPNEFKFEEFKFEEFKPSTIFDGMSEEDRKFYYNTYNVLLKNLPADSAKAFGIRSIIPAIVTLIKTSKEIIQVSKNGGTENGFNLLRNKLIVYVRDMKSILKLFCR